MNEKTLTLLQPASYELRGRPFIVPNNMEINTIRSGRGVRLEYPKRTRSAIANGERLAKEIQQSLSSVEIGSFDDEMRSLRGRSWSL